MPDSIQALREERQVKATSARHLLDNTSGSAWGEEQSTAYDGLVAEIDTLDEQINRHQKLIDREASAFQSVRVISDVQNVGVDEATAIVARRKGVFGAWARGDISRLSDDDREILASNMGRPVNTLSTTTGSEGGFTVDTILATQLLQEMQAFGGMRSVSQVVQSSDGSEIQWPTTDATAQEGEIVAQNAAVSNLDPTFGTVSHTTFKYSSKEVAVPMELLQDTVIDLEGYINNELLPTRIGRITNRHFTVGTGSGEPEGVTVASALGFTAALNSAITYDEFTEVEHSVDPAYRMSPNTRWMFHDQTLKAVKLLKDADGRPLWVPGVDRGEPDTLLRYPYTINQHMAQIGTLAVSMLFGDFSQYLIRDVATSIEIFRMTDSNFTRKGQVGFLAFMRSGGKLIAASGNGIKHLKHPA